MLSLKQIRAISKEQGHKTVLFDNNKSIDWIEYKMLVEQNILTLLKNGMINEKTTRAIIISENRWELLVLSSVLGTLGIAYSGIDYTQAEDKKIESINVSNANTVFFSETKKPSTGMLGTLSSDIRYFNINSIHDVIYENPTKIVDNQIENFKHKDDIVSFSFTSGTTGLPKAIYRTSSFDKQRIDILTKKYNFDYNDIYLITLPLYHVSVIGWIKLTLVNGGSIVFSDFNSKKDLYYKLTNYNVSAFLITPPVLKIMVDELETNRFINKTVRFIMVGGKNLPTILKDRTMALFGPVLNEYYGSSETGINTLSDSIDEVRYPASSGRVMEGSDIAIIDDLGNNLGIEEIGHIAIHSFQNASGYINREMKEVIFNKKKYVFTSDFGYKNREGYIFVTQRVLFDNNTVLNNLFNLENNIRLLRGVSDVVIVENENNTYSINVEFENNVSTLGKNIVKNAINGLLSNTVGEFIINLDTHINYSLSGKVKYNEFLEE